MIESHLYNIYIRYIDNIETSSFILSHDIEFFSNILKFPNNVVSGYLIVSQAYHPPVSPLAPLNPKDQGDQLIQISLFCDSFLVAILKCINTTCVNIE